MDDMHPIWILGFVTLGAAIVGGIWQISRVAARRRKDEAHAQSTAFERGESRES